jgi:hypothetical protein
MRLSLGTSLCVCVAASFMLGASANAAVLDRVQVGVPGNPVTQGFARSLSLSLASPEGFDRGCCYDGMGGEWVGPAWHADDDPSFGGLSAIDWSVEFSKGNDPALLARAAAWAAWPEAAGAETTVAHIVSGREVGTLPGFYVIDAEPSPGARHQGVVVVYLSRGLYGIALFDLESPWADSSDFPHTFVVDGQIPSVWARAQTEASLAGVKVEGNLPPRYVSAARIRAHLRGSVRDAFNDPLSHARVRLERKGSVWRRVARGWTGGRGRYSFTPPRPGLYRVSASFAGVTVRSRAVRIPRG